MTHLQPYDEVFPITAEFLRNSKTWKSHNWDEFELWKPQKKQNEGFDFHTVCSNEFINFGEAKYSGSTNPHGNAINQSKGFVDDQKHLRDYVHLRALASEAAVENLNNDSFGIVASFSINTEDPFKILKNAIESAQEKLNLDSIKAVYLVGVSQ